MTKKSRRVAKARRMLLTLSLVLVVAFAAVGGTVAWLTDNTEEVKNTFTVGDINIEISETDADNDGKPLENKYKMVPGAEIAKDPKVTVKAGSEASYLFVKVTESANLDAFITYDIASGWNELTVKGTKVENVYWRKVDATIGNNTATTPATDKDVTFDILAGNKVEVNEGVTKENMEALTDTTRPTLNFKSAAVQQLDIADEAAAYDQIKDKL